MKIWDIVTKNSCFYVENDENGKKTIVLNNPDEISCEYNDIDVSCLYAQKLISKRERIDGNFSVAFNRLKRLESFPRIVEGSFDCSFNKLDTLEGSPEEVGGDFICTHNKIVSLEGISERIGGSVYIFKNHLKSLKGIQKRVNGNFDCSYNSLKTLEGGPKYVEGDYDCSGNNIKNLKGLPKYVGGDFICIHNTRNLSEDEIKKRVEVKGRIILSKKIKENINWYKSEDISEKSRKVATIAISKAFEMFFNNANKNENLIIKRREK